MPISVKTNTSNSYKVLWNKCINKLYYPIKNNFGDRNYVKRACHKNVVSEG